MGNNQPGGLNNSKRERPGEGAGGQRIRNISGNQQMYSSSNEDGCPVSVKIAKSDVSPNVQFSETSEMPVVFRWTCNNTNFPRNVQICGSWDDWQSRIPLVKSQNDFSTILDLIPGENNVIFIDEADFEVFDALDKDLASSNAGEVMRGSPNTQPSHDTPNDRELEKLRSFGQDIPDRKEFSKANNPPHLPPHLLQVILNKDTPVQCDPNVLPEPNHVMLNHLYALSIKDGVMVLSATHRYRKKYVTTLLYKPI
ncbi:hypothetical protein WR25_23704 isoform A [Diploscapter pachys]|nr:hypothetical protein WR25_23704 isoform A [Diploscapter pachys]